MESGLRVSKEVLASIPNKNVPVTVSGNNPILDADCIVDDGFDSEPLRSAESP